MRAKSGWQRKFVPALFCALVAPAPLPAAHAQSASWKPAQSASWKPAQSASWQQAQYRIGERLVQPERRASSAYKETSWDALIPKDWDPLKELRALNLDTLSDGDRRAIEAMEVLRGLWDKAPINTALEGTPIKLAGFVVPLEEGKDGLREFLLVPYFGACIHVPPPPANQIVHVLSAHGVKARSMDAVWVSGTLKAARAQTQMGASGYRMDAVSVEAYREKPARR